MAEDKTKCFLRVPGFYLMGMIFIAVISCAVFTPRVSHADSFSDFCSPPRTERVNDKWGGRTRYEQRVLIKELGSRMRYSDAQDTLASLSNRLAPRGEDNTHVVIPDPDDQVVLNGKNVPFVIEKGKVETCSEAIATLQGLEPMPNDKKYACALLAVDKRCLTGSAAQSNISDLRIPKRSLVVMSFLGKAFCTGILLDEKTLLTSRHCFVQQTNGSLLAEFNSNESPGFSIQTIDLERRVLLSKEAIAGLRMPTGFDIDKDPVTLSVETVKASTALPLAKVVFKPAQAKQLIWVAGPFALLDQAIAMQNAYQNPGSSTPRVQWQDSIRWSNSEAAQCRVEYVSKSCIYHTCQTSEGYSGSPMISAVYSKPPGSNEIIEVVGVHSGTPGLVASGGWPACSISSASFNASDYSVYNVGKSGGF